MLMPHPNPRIAIPVAIGLVFVVAVGAYVFAKVSQSTGVQVTPVVVDKVTLTPTPVVSIVPTATPSIAPDLTYDHYSSTIGSVAYQVDYPSTWSVPSQDAFVSYDPRAVDSGRPADLTAGAKLEVYVVNSTADISAAAQDDQGAMKVNAKTILGVNGEVTQYDSTNSVGVRKITDYTQFGIQGPIFATRISIGSTSDADSVQRLQYVTIFQKFASSLKMQAAPAL